MTIDDLPKLSSASAAKNAKSNMLVNVLIVSIVCCGFPLFCLINILLFLKVIQRYYIYFKKASLFVFFLTFYCIDEFFRVV